jgi:hypothetical protein
MTTKRKDMQNIGVLSLGFGKPEYISMAKALARSLILHDPKLPRAIVTDSNDPELLELFTHRIELRPEYGSNLRQKIYLDRYSPFSRTLFIDSDCLALRKLDGMWRAFDNVPFGVCGVRVLKRGESDEFLDIDFVLDRFGLQGLPKFNGGTYYFDDSPGALEFFETARGLLKEAVALRFSDFRGDGPNDESIYSVAMAIHGLTVTDTGDGGMWTPIAATSPIVIDVPKGICHFVKLGRIVTPDVVHFATFTDSFTYLRECLKLECLSRNVSVRGNQLARLRAEAVGRWMRKKSKAVKRRFLAGGSLCLRPEAKSVRPSLPSHSTYGQ